MKWHYAAAQGVVAFFPSFAYADQVHARWQASGALAALAGRKAVFREPRCSTDVEAVLRRACRHPHASAECMDTASVLLI